MLIAGRVDFHMGGDLLQAFSAVQEGVPVVNIAAIFQKHPQVIVAHPGEAESWEDLKDLTLLIGDNGFQSYYQWMIKAHGFTGEQREAINRLAGEKISWLGDAHRLALREIGDAGSAPVLAGLLTDAESYVRYSAANALRYLPTSAAMAVACTCSMTWMRTAAWR